MKLKILFPCSPINSKEVDSNFENEYNVSKTLGIESFFFDHDLFVDEGRLKFSGLKEEKSEVILRGWMLKSAQYEKLYKFLKDKEYYLMNSPESYVNCHYLKNSYKFIEKHTAKTLFSEKFDKETLGAMFDQFENGIILKDYVKSEKGVPGIFRIPKETTHEQLEQVVAKFIDFRGKLFNEGVSFRDFVKLKKHAGEVNEWRVFVFMGKVVALEQNSNIDTQLNKIEKPSDEFIRMATHQLNLVSFFYTVDLAEKEDGDWMIIETGDGQVSGLAPNQNPIGLYNSFVTKLGGC